MVQLEYPQVTISSNPLILTYDPAGDHTYGGFDRFGRIVDQKWLDASSNVKDRYQYAYDYNSNRTYRDNTQTSGKDEYYNYDNLNRLTGYDRGDRSGSTVNNKVRNEAWGLSAVGNWNDYQINTNPAEDSDYTDAGDLDQDREHNKANEIYDATDAITEQSDPQQAQWADPVYSARGNATTIPRPNDLENTYTCEYDAWNRLMKVKQGANVVAEYRYDGLNRRIRKFTDKDDDEWTVREFYYNAGWQLLETRKQTKTRTGNPLTEPALATTLHKQYVWSARYIDAPVLLWRDAIGNGTLNETLYYTTDANFNVTAVVNTSGQAVERYMYDPYGKVTFLTGAWAKVGGTGTASAYANEILYCGYRYDSETGLYHVRMRMYHAHLGRWMNRDPGHCTLVNRICNSKRGLNSQYNDGLNLYQYVTASPIRYVDPWGLSVIQVDQTLNTFWGYDMDPIEEFCKDQVDRVDINDWADEEEILDEHLDKMDTNDIWIYLGHTVSDEGGKVIGILEHDSILKGPWMGSDLVTTEQLVKAMTSGGRKHGPGLVMLGGCKSCQMADDFLNSGTRCVVCSEGDWNDANAATFVENMMKELCKNKKTLRQAFDEASLMGSWQKRERDQTKVQLKCKGGEDWKTLKKFLGK